MEFPDLALTKFLQTSPQLGSMIVNFTDVSEQSGNAENTDIKVGVFTLGVADQFAFVPVVAKGGTVYPIDSIFQDETKSFTPLTPKTATALTASLGNNAGASLGKSKKIPKTVPKNPDVSSLVSPPRTGKYAYASESKMLGFLSVLPDHLKKFTFEKFASEKTLYDALDKAFGLKAVFSVLRETAQDSVGGNAVNSTGTGPKVFQKSMTSIITTPAEVAALADESASAAFLRDGYVVRTGTSPARTVVPAFELKESRYKQVSPQTDPNTTYQIAFKDGSTRTGYLPKYHTDFTIGISGTTTIFEDGTTGEGTLIAHGDPAPAIDGLSRIFDHNPPKLLVDCTPDERVMLITNSGDAIGPFYVRSVVRTNSGAEVKVSGATMVDKIVGMRSFKFEAEVIERTLYVPSNIIVQSLGGIADGFEQSVNTASNRSEMFTAGMLGAELDITHDGVEYFVNREPMGKQANAMKYLVEQEQIEPSLAHSFLKQANEEKRIKLFLTKKAATASSVTATEIPSFGEKLQPSPEVGLNGSFLPSVQSAAGLQDNQTTEATIISQLLQVPDMTSYVQEYLPYLEESVDKLGRILFVMRLKSDELSSDLDSDSLFAMVDKVRNVYRQLGDTVNSLKETSNSLRQPGEADGV